ncbi:VCBS repeat-containing protein [Rhodocaloribacter sp.]
MRHLRTSSPISPEPRRRPAARLAFALALGLSACASPAPEPEAPLFTRVPARISGVTFVNRIVEDEGFNVLEYEYFYNGAGVAVGDVDNDGLPDLFFTANMGPNRLYRNKGGFVFEDVTEQAGLAETAATWDTGGAMADVNGDGRLDIYVCRSGRVSEDRRRNALYVNNGDGTFTERAAAYGLDDPAYSTHAAFFDYDRDGDLDLYLLNHPIRRLNRFDVALLKRQRDPLAGDKLYRNDGGRFTDVSAEAGILGNPIGFGLSVTVSDLNDDGFPDLFVANDYVEDDYLYLNNGDGTFTERIRDALAHSSYSSMGADVADFNNDARPDILTLDMLAEDHRRQKLLKGPDGYERFAMLRGFGYHPQYMRNMLQRNNGNGTFSEIGQMAGVSNTDWSWAPLLADFDLDGWKDLFVTNGYLRDYTNLDFLATLDRALREAKEQGRPLDPLALVRQMPSTPLANYAYRNNGDGTFENRSAAWGLAEPGFSNGAAYADLDDDGDLDLVVNNVNAEAFVYRNHAERYTDRHHLKVRLDGPPGNRFGIGAKVTLTTDDGRRFFQEMIPGRGYQSTVEPVLLFGLGAATRVRVAVTWPDGRRQSLAGVVADRTLTLRHADASEPTGPEPPEDEAPPLFAPLPGSRGLAFAHREDPFVDFEREPLLPHMLSRLGPALARADVNRDGLPDVFVGGAKGQPAALFLQQIDGRFRRAPLPAFDADRAFEDVDALFFDADGDHDLDLYVVSGGSDVPRDAPGYQDRLYVNNGFGRLSRAPGALPAMPASGGVVAAHDFDGDGDLDLFAGGRVLPGRYPLAPRSYLLENDGDGHFTDVTEEAAEALVAPGMVTAALWRDLDGDGAAELVLAGEWMPLRVFRVNADHTFTEITEEAGLARTNGWWNALAAADFDGDGDLDLVAGNRGLNAPMRATPDEPAAIYAADFDRNGFVDAVMSYFIHGKPYPVPARDELLAQIPSLAERFPTYASYAGATIDDVLPRADAVTLEAFDFETRLFENLGDGTFRPRRLPLEAQISQVNALIAADFDRDGAMDVLMAGNNFGVRPQWGAYDAGQGLLLRGRGDGTFEPVTATRSGFFAPGEVRGMVVVPTPAGPILVAAPNDAPLAVFALLLPDVPPS